MKIGGLSACCPKCGSIAVRRMDAKASKLRCDTCKFEGKRDRFRQQPGRNRDDREVIFGRVMPVFYD